MPPAAISAQDDSISAKPRPGNAPSNDIFGPGQRPASPAAKKGRHRGGRGERWCEKLSASVARNAPARNAQGWSDQRGATVARLGPRRIFTRRRTGSAETVFGRRPGYRRFALLCPKLRGATDERWWGCDPRGRHEERRRLARGCPDVRPETQLLRRRGTRPANRARSHGRSEASGSALIWLVPGQLTRLRPSQPRHARAAA